MIPPDIEEILKKDFNSHCDRYPFKKELQQATEKECKAPWGCVPNGKNFRCGFCGYKFKQGDKWRGVYTNDIPKASGNPLVCESCNDTVPNLRRKWYEKNQEWLQKQEWLQDKWWWFRRT